MKDETGKKTSFCGLGSVKTQIGHLESAAGIAGLIKIVLSLQHKKLPGNLHFKEQNPYIELEGTPFRIIKETENWECLKDKQGENIPRRAGLSSFGSGGANAHVIVEEYHQEVKSIYQSQEPAIIVLSAKNEERLKEQVENLKTYLEQNKEINLYDVAYTLQVGRDGMEERLAMIVNNTDELIKELIDYQNRKIKGLFIGNIKKDKAEFLLEDEPGRAYIQTAIETQNTKSLAQLWVNGVAIDWNLLYGAIKPNKLSLPNYPFVREKYWYDRHTKKVSKPYLQSDKSNNTVSLLHLSTNSTSLIKESPKDEKVQLKTATNVTKDTQAVAIVDSGFSALLPVKVMEIDHAQRVLRELLAGALYIENNKIEADEKFVDMGLDSVIGVELIRKINERFNIELAATDLYNYPTVNTLSKYIYDQLPVEKPEALFSLVKDEIELPSSELGDKQVKKDLKLTQESYNLEPISSPKGVSDIAIIGMSGVFPGSEDLDAFWELLKLGTNLVTKVPKNRWDMLSYYDKDPDTKGKSYSKWMGTLDDIALFDPLFFNLSPREAELMDPQQRLFLEQSWKTIEDAGYSPKTLSNSSCGVFIGVGQGDYNIEHSEVFDLESYNLTGSNSSILSARVSYLLNLKGPCMSIDTACSSSLVAIAQACDSIILDNSDMALAGGVCILTTPRMHIMTSKAGMLSADGRCYTFDQKANGFVPGEGVGVIMLKKLELAERDGDHIYGVINGWGVNQDGSTNGITAPSDQSQTALQKGVYDRFDIDPETISYVEAHGTGTKLGDPIEIKALKKTFTAYTKKANYCALGSVKTNIGHTLAAAGISGMIKVLLSLRHKQIPATINYDKLNEHIKLKNSAFYINTELKDWKPEDNNPRRAAVSSFGFSGTNAHVVIGEYGRKENIPYQDKNPAIIVLSAKNQESLKRYSQKLKSYLEENKRINLYDIAYTLQVGREAMEERLAIITKETNELIEQLVAYQEGKADNIITSNSKKEKLDFIVKGKAGKAYIKEAIEAKEVESLAQLWIKGVDIDWNLLYADNKPNKISLPTYPFVKERYWYDGSTGRSFSSKTIASTIKKVNLSSVSEGTNLTEDTHKPETRLTLNLTSARTLSKRINQKEGSSYGIDAQQDNKTVKAYTQNQVLGQLADLLAHALFIEADKIDREEKFIDMGLDSIIGVELIKNINEQLEIELAVTDLYNYPNLNLLTGFVYKKLPKVGSQLPGSQLTSPALPLDKIPSIPGEMVSFIIDPDDKDQPDYEKQKTPAIAIIGMSCRLPGSPNADIFWENLREGRNMIVEVPEERWKLSSYYDPDPEAKGKSYSKWMGVLEDIDKFDPLFFNISPKEAELMDPQQRLFLEESWKAIEDAGYSPKTLSNSSCGVFIGVGQGDYNMEYSEVSDLESYSLTGNTSSILSARVSYLLNLKGPCMSIDTACSSSLVAIAQGCDSLVNHSSDMVLTGGVCVLTTPRMHIHDQ